MKRYLAALVLILFAAAPARPADDAGLPAQPITSLAVLHSLTNDQANHSLRVAFEGIVTYYRRGNADLFVQDGNNAIYALVRSDLNLALGDRVLVTGTTDASFRPEIMAESVKFLRHDTPPPPVPATYRQMIRGDLDAQRATLRGKVESADVVMDGGSQKLYMHVRMEDGSIDAEGQYDGSIRPADLLDDEVELTGSVAGEFDYKMQLTGVVLQMPTLAEIRILKPAETRSSELPVMPMDEILRGYDAKGHLLRTRIQGTVTYYQPGAALVLQRGQKSLWVTTKFEQPLAIGQQVDVTGFPTVRNGSLALSRGEVQDSGTNAPIAPALLSAAALNDGTHAFDLVSVEGKLLMSVRDSGQDQYVLVSPDGHLYSAILRHPENGLNQPLPRFKNVEIGSTIRMTGVCVVENGDRYLGHVAFEVLLRSPEDIAVLRGPSILSVRNLIGVVIFLLVVVLAAAARQWRVERRVRRQAADQAQVEKRRARILEGINNKRPMEETFGEIIDLVHFRLHGATCWIELADGTYFGDSPDQSTDQAPQGHRIVEVPVSGSGRARLGVLRAAFPPASPSDPLEETTLLMAASLVALDTETRRLYSELIHRSEFDMLTEVHNRFSFEKKLDQTLSEYDGTGRIFGLIYMDLDNFKQINDQFGHHVGDLYLQACVARMKGEIRPSDLLARIGGDEFALLVSEVTDHQDVIKIAARIKDCFRERFTIGHYTVDGSASLGIALYPDDGATKDALLNAADAAMYMDKNSKIGLR
jgi:diguanylate cyclase (GGDEF)-like protein